MKVDLHWLTFEKPTAIDLDKLDIRVPYGTEPQYTLSFQGSTFKSNVLRYGLIMLLVKTGTVSSSDPIKILRVIEKMSGENGKKLIRSALDYQTTTLKDTNTTLRDYENTTLSKGE